MRHGAGRAPPRAAGALLAATGLQTPGGRSVRTLSGGEQQRLVVAVAVANEPPLLLADEPTSQLDRANVARVLELLRVLRGPDRHHGRHGHP